MTLEVDKIILEIFKDIPESRKLDSIKEKVKEVLNGEYQELLKHNTELKATGELIQKYGSIEEITSLIYLTEEEKSALTKEDIKTIKEVKKSFFKQRLINYSIAFCFIFIVGSIVNLILDYHWVFLLLLFLFSGIACGLFYPFIILHKKNINLKIESTAGEYIRSCSDRYTKKLVNSFLISIGTIFYIFILWFYYFFASGLKDAEILQNLLSFLGFYGLIIYLLVKNILCKINCQPYIPYKINLAFKRNLIWLTIASVLYWLIVTLTITLLIVYHIYHFSYPYYFIVVYGVLIFGYNILIRPRYVFQNLRINIKRSLTYALMILVFSIYQLIGMDNYFIQPYISSVSKINIEPSTIDYDTETGIYTIITKKEDFRILQLTDIHLGGSIMSFNKDLKALQTVYELMNYAKPDLVIVTGDMVFPMGVMSFSRNNATPLLQFADFMRNIGIPWAFTYGNHDTERMATQSAEEINELLKSVAFKTSGNFLYPYIQPDIYGRNNQVIEVRKTDGTLLQALFLIDSNDYVSGLNDYDYIHDDQVEWYEKQIKRLQQTEKKEVSSMAFFHMPLQEYKEAYDLYLENSPLVKYFHGIIGETMIDSICCSDYLSKFFDKAVELRSTKAMFCGHDHYNNISLEYKGIRLTYGYSIDYLAMPGIENDTDQRGATIIDVTSPINFVITPVLYKDIAYKN